jgi:hypothetical protein
MNKWKRRARKWRKLYRAQTYLLGVEQEYSADGSATLHKALGRARSLKRANAILSKACDEHLKRARRAETLHKASARCHMENIEQLHVLYDRVNDIAAREAAAVKNAKFWQMRYESADKAGMEAFDKMLAWQRRLKEATPAECIPVTAAGTAYMCIAADDYDALMQAMEPKEEPC